jgi:hypothetical protein
MEDFKMDEVGKVYSTKEYSIFKKLHGNRDVLEFRKKQLIESISERGWIRNPIVVNEKMEVIDGQGRLEALQELGMAVEYVVASGATIDDCVALNIKQSNWRLIDYVNCFADMGKSDYITLLSLYGKYQYLTESCVNTLAGRGNTDGKVTGPEIKSGNFTFYDRETLYELLEFTDKCMGFVGNGMGRVRHWCAVFKFVFYCKKIPNDVFLERLERNRAFIKPTATLKQTLECVEQINNFGAKKHKIYFIPEWDMYMKTR